MGRDPQALDTGKRYDCGAARWRQQWREVGGAIPAGWWPELSEKRLGRELGAWGNEGGVGAMDLGGGGSRRWGTPGGAVCALDSVRLAQGRRPTRTRSTRRASAATRSAEHDKQNNLVAAAERRRP